MLVRMPDSAAEQLPMHLSAAMLRAGAGGCTLHGGPSPGAPVGNSHALKHGRYTAQAIL